MARILLMLPRIRDWLHGIQVDPWDDKIYRILNENYIESQEVKRISECITRRDIDVIEPSHLPHEHSASTLMGKFV